LKRYDNLYCADKMVALNKNRLSQLVFGRLNMTHLIIRLPRRPIIVAALEAINASCAFSEPKRFPIRTAEATLRAYGT
jgi:hypothetical protein